MINLVAVAVTAASLLMPQSTFGWVCPTLDRDPTEAGVWDVVLGAYQRGLTSDSAAEQIVLQVVNNCPEYVPIVKQWAEDNG